MSRSEICEDSLVLAAVCCCTLTSAASAKCISVFLSGLSSKFLQPMHLQMDEHMIFAFRREGNVNNSLLHSTRCERQSRVTFNSSCENISVSKRETHLVALAVVLQAARPFAIATFAVPTV